METDVLVVEVVDEFSTEELDYLSILEDNQFYKDPYGKDYTEI